MKVSRTERIWIEPNTELNRLCHIAKNLYNEANYIIRKNFLETGKWIRYCEVYRLLKQSENFKNLPSGVPQQIFRLLDKSWKSFFNALKEYKKDKNKFKARPKMPKYKNKNGMHILVFTYLQCRIKNGILVFPKKINLEVKTRLDDKVDLREVRIVPQGVGFVIEIVYKKEVPDVPSTDPKCVVGIDFGIRNIVTMANNIGEKPIVVKGGISKSINQYYNKVYAKLQSIYDTLKISNTPKRFRKLSDKRNRKINDFMHKVSKLIIKWCIYHNIDTIVCGYNTNWKQNANLGKQNNQTFVQIPFYKLIQMIKYKAEDNGIRVLEIDESHTSKCSFLDNEPIEHRENYVGKRISRGLFRSANGKIINADLNGAYNIIRKAIPKAFSRENADGIEGVWFHPEILRV